MSDGQQYCLSRLDGNILAKCQELMGYDKNDTYDSSSRDAETVGCSNGPG